MKIAPNSSTIEDLEDASLVIASREGNRQAFGKIVARYQRLLCSLAYSSLGSLSESEDLAQEAFVEAWKKMGKLKEPEKLKSWLCGILRFKLSHHKRKQARQPTYNADPIEESGDLGSDEAPIEELAMKQEEQALLWKALESLPDNYRETLILYYREQRSIEHVACELDLSEDAVKQRLSRGRKRLQEEVTNFVESALTRTAPGSAFTTSVLTLIGATSPPTKTTIVAAKIGTTFKLGAIATALSSLSGVVSSLLVLRTNLDHSRTERERVANVTATATLMGLPFVFVGVMLGMRWLAAVSSLDAKMLAILTQVLVVAFSAFYVLLTQRVMKSARRLRTDEKMRFQETTSGEGRSTPSAPREFKSRWRLLGVPLVHAKLAIAEAGEKPAYGWIAAGHRAYGLLFAWGGIAIAPISVGILSVGILTAGAIGFGAIGIGAVGLGGIAIGVAALGLQSIGAYSALGWNSAVSDGFSIAREAAIGRVALAEQVNNEAASSMAHLSLLDQSQVPALLAIGITILLSARIYASWAGRSKPNEDRD